MIEFTAFIKIRPVKLWKTYSSMEDDFLVCRAVKLGFLSKEDVPEKVAEGIFLDRPVFE